MDDASPFLAAAGLTDATVVGGGLEFTVFRAASEKYGPVALRVARCTVYENANDPHVDAARLIEQEMNICRHLEGTHVPVARHYGLLRSGGRVASLDQFVETDDSTASDTEMGHILGLLHHLPLTSLPNVQNLVAQEGGLNTMQLLPRRLTRRWAELRRLVPTLPHLVSPQYLGHIFNGIGARSSDRLLHMDMRPANLRTRGGKIVAVLDWSNALVGPPPVDLFRLLELVRPGPGFLAAYQVTGPPLVRLSLPEETALRLDAAVMLALVFLSEQPDPQLAPQWVQRVQDLNQTLCEALQ